MKLEEAGFRKLSPEDKPLFDSYYDKMNGYWASSVCFVGMNAWNHSITTYYKVIGEHIVCLAWDSVGKRMVLLPFFGYYTEENIKETMYIVKEEMEKLSLPVIMTDVSEWMKPYYESIPGMSWEVFNDRGLCDYIYQAEDFRNSLDSQESRYNYRYFVRKFNPKLEIMTPDHREECVEFVKQVWCTVHECSECEYGCLKDTISEVVTWLKQLDAHGIVVRIEEKMVAYSIVTCRNGLGIYQFKKSERGYRGINEYLHRECFERFLKDAKVINYTEDMNLEGLRKYKSKLAPYTLEPKYELQERS